ncbi:DUF3800 domain-containing protein [Acidiferrobacter sp. SPIII_3]|uniref:DUF3800 domain-containing protein n=1 Tax=Acidiferrobacter sp. SPIII_3 TaxID=1281578 RepID=UPI00143E0D5A|nr:DUF3800 domain-containing protein [Acidiferrobacter sp. SPIII_3]
MLVFIDESGDPGFKVTKGSTSHFVLAMVIFRDRQEAERASAAIREAKLALRVKTEFKFNKCCDNVRDGFFQAVRPFRFGVRAIVVDKARVYSTHLRTEKEDFYRYFVRQMVTHDGQVLKKARLKIDGSGNREFRRELWRYLRENARPGAIEDLRFVDSSQDTLIQLADMAAGAIARSYNADARKNATRWQGQLKGKIENVWNFR